MILSFPRSGNEAKRGVGFRHSTKASGVRSEDGTLHLKEERSVLTFESSYCKCDGSGLSGLRRINYFYFNALAVQNAALGSVKRNILNSGVIKNNLNKKRFKSYTQ